MESIDQQRVALVTGAGRGIGRAIAVKLAEAGFRLCLVARTREELEETRRLTGLAPADSLIVLADLADLAAPENVFGAVTDHFGRIDLLVNNAGWAPARTPLIRLTADEIVRVLTVNLHAPIALMRLAAQAMKASEGGAIINIASMAARTLTPGESVYAAAKAGLIAFTHCCFNELRGDGIRIAVIIPGLTDTALIPHNKQLDRSAMLRPEEVAEAVIMMVNSAPNVCPVELALAPARDPMRAR